MQSIRLALVSMLGAIAMAGCAAHGSAVAVAMPHDVTAPQVAQQQGTGSYLEFPLDTSFPGASLEPSAGLTVWFCAHNEVGFLDMLGNQTIYPAPSGCDYLNFTNNIANNPDGDIFLSNGQSGISRISPSGQFTNFVLPSFTGTIVSDSLGNVWTSDGTGNPVIFEVDPDTGAYVSYTVPGSSRQYIGDMIAPPDGTVWFEDYDIASSRFSIIQVNQAGSFLAYQVTAPPHGDQPLVVGNDDGIWFAGDNAMGRIDRQTGVLTYYPVPSPFMPISMVVGPDKTIYYIDHYTSRIFRFNYAKGIERTSLPMPGEYNSMTMGPDHNLWLSNWNTHRIDVRLIQELTTQPTSFTLSVDQDATLTVSETHAYHPMFSASTSNTGCATVTTGDAPDQFVIHGAGAGSCIVTASDAHGNSVDVPVTVN